jgi:5-enolpyruvylshikimate-3-phosphate synthase
MIVDADLRVPGDKSITHRALILAGMARGTSRIGGALTSLDARSTARVLRQLGVEVSPPCGATSLSKGATASAGRVSLRQPGTRRASSSAPSPRIPSHDHGGASPAGARCGG